MLTVSEELFERLCAVRGVLVSRIATGAARTADYRFSLGATTCVAELKQLDETPEDRQMAAHWGTPHSDGATAPSARVRGLLQDAYPQIKASAAGTAPGMIVLYNNTGPWNDIDTFTVSKAMFGSFGFVLGLTQHSTVAMKGHGYLGKRTVTKDMMRALSVVGVLSRSGDDGVWLDCYHNPFATVPIAPECLRSMADRQFLHSAPHARGFTPWAPIEIA